VIIAPEIHRNLRHVFSSWNEVSRSNGELNSHGENAYDSAARTHRLSSRRTPDYIDIRPDNLPQISTDTHRRHEYLTRYTHQQAARK